MLDLSRNLVAIYDYELSLSNRVSRVDEPAGSDCPLAIIFQDPLHFDDIAQHLEVPATVKKWENHDSHYPLEAGFLCLETRHAIAGPSPWRKE